MKTYKTSEGRMTESDIAKMAASKGVRAAAKKLGLPKSTVSDIGRRVRRESDKELEIRMVKEGALMGLPYCVNESPVCAPPPIFQSLRSEIRHRPKLLVIPDAHAHPDHDNNRFVALGRFINSERPDYVVSIGDFADMPSLSSYDRGTRGFEGRRYRRDVEATLDAQERMFREVSEPTKIAWHKCLGNHEDRIDRATNAHSELFGTIGTDDLGYREFGWEVHPYLSPIKLHGIMFCHYFASGVLGRPIGGINVGAALCNKLHQSAVQGHSHVFNHAEATRPDGQKIFGMSVGCFSHPGHIEGWNAATHHNWWRGVVVLDDLDGEGYYDQIRCITLRKLMRDYL